MTAYTTLKPVRFAELFDGTLERWGIQEQVTQDTTDLHRWLTDGNNGLWVVGNEAGFVASLTRFASSGAPGRILSAISEAFDTDIASEHEPQFWGYDTEEEWDAVQMKRVEEHEEQS